MTGPAAPNSDSPTIARPAVNAITAVGTQDTIVKTKIVLRMALLPLGSPWETPNSPLSSRHSKDSREEPFESLTAQTTEQMEKQTQGAMENYFGWLQKSMSSFPWGNTNPNRILLSNATTNVSAIFAFVQKLGQAKDFKDVVKIQTEFMQTQMNSFNQQAKVLGEIYAKAAEDAMKTPFGVRE
jgi:Phasin protein